MVDFTKPVQTRAGLKARVICTDKKYGAPLVFLYTNLRGEEHVGYANSDGSFRADGSNRPHHFDLVNVQEKHPHADTIIAWANGAKIQARWGSSEWADAPAPRWYHDYEYRIKPNNV